MSDPSGSARAVSAFALLLFLLSVPLWLAGAVLPLELLPGLPATTILLVFIPLVAACVSRLRGVPLPSPQLSAWLALVLFVAFFIAASAEEAGWSGYLIDRVQTRWPAFEAGVLVGALWGAWHVVPLIMVHRSETWIAWWFVFTVAGRVIIVWLYNRTGKSVFAAILYHTMSNVSVYLYPTHGSHFDPRTTGTIVALVAGIITMTSGVRHKRPAA